MQNILSLPRLFHLQASFFILQINTRFVLEFLFSK